MGLSIMNRGLTEYEIYENKTSDIALTLLRGVGFLGKTDLSIRPGRASGMPIATPKAQCLGKNISEYSILVHKGTVDDAKVANHAAAYNVNATVVQNILKHSLIEKNFKQFFDIYDIESLQENITEKIQNCRKGSYEFIKIDSDSLIISAIKKAEKEDALILRIYNPFESICRPVEIKINIDINEVFECDLLENSINKIQSRNNSFMTNIINGYSIQSYKITLKS
jgi:mannosylglycerate hydrolase